MYGDSCAPFFVVVFSEIEIVYPSGAVETIIIMHGYEELTGEVNMLFGRKAPFRVRATRPDKVIELDRQYKMALLQRDT
jgi:hypothetical protein